MSKQLVRVPDGQPTPNAPFVAGEGEVAEKDAFHNTHDLREMYSRENTERRRMGGHTVRRMFTQAQDKTFIAKGAKIRDEYEVANNDDVAIVLAQIMIADGKEAELDPALVALAKKAVIPKRTTPVY